MALLEGKGKGGKQKGSRVQRELTEGWGILILVHIRTGCVRGSKNSPTAYQKRRGVSLSFFGTPEGTRLNFLPLRRKKIMVLPPSSRGQATVHRTVAFKWFSSLPKNQKSRYPNGYLLFCIWAHILIEPPQGGSLFCARGFTHTQRGFILRLGGSRFLQIIQIIVVSVKLVDLRLIIIT